MSGFGVDMTGIFHDDQFGPEKRCQFFAFFQRDIWIVIRVDDVKFLAV